MSQDNSGGLKVLAISGTTLGLLSLAFAAYLYATKPKLAFVYNDKLLSEYKGIKEGQKIYEDKVMAMTANLDTLEKEINRDIKEYQDNFKTLSDKEKKLRESYIQKRQNDYFNYKNVIQQKITEEDKKMSEAVMKQINTYIIEFGKSNGYDYVFGVSNEGSLFYAREADDVTGKVLDGLNKKYDGK